MDYDTHERVPTKARDPDKQLIRLVTLLVLVFCYCLMTASTEGVWRIDGHESDGEQPVGSCLPWATWPQVRGTRSVFVPPTVIPYRP
jgi:hypothetical protein